LAANLVFYLGYALMPFGKAVGSAGGLGNFVAPNFMNLFNIQKGLESAIQMWVGGLFGNPLLVMLAVAGMFPIMNLTRRFDRLMLLWVAVLSLVLFIVPFDNYFFYRILYLVPMQILATLGLYWILSKLENEMKLGTNGNFQILKIALTTLVLLFLLNYALRSVDGAPIHILEQATTTLP